MQTYEYKVVPAPNRGQKARGVKTPEARFAHGIEVVLNEMAAEGWEYQRADMLPSEERAGLTGSKTTWRNLLVFRRPLPAPQSAGQAEPTLTAAADPTEATPAPVEAAAPAHTTTQTTAEVESLVATAGDPHASPEAIPVPGPGARRMISDDGVEELSPVSGLTAALQARAKSTKPED